MQAIASDCEFEVERGPDWLLVRVRNLSSVSHETSSLAARLWALLQQHFTHRLVLELDETVRLDRQLVEELRQLYERIAEHEGIMRLCGVSKRNRDILHAFGLDERLLPYQDRMEAVTGCIHPR